MSRTAWSGSRIRTLATILSALLLGVAAASAAEAPASDWPQVARVYYDETAQIRMLTDFDLFEFNDRVRRYVLVGVSDADELERLRRVGLRVEIDAERSLDLRPRPRLAGQVAGIPGFPCYRTVQETYDTATQIVADHPTLASWNTIGESWEKLSGEGGWNLQVLRLTNAAVPGPKPKLLITASIHAREYAPAELTTRFAEYLVGNHGTDPDVTWILDWNEVHLVLHANPDGRTQAETGLSWRKNTNRSYCSPTSTSRGVDLNRNFAVDWGCCGGSSGSQCDILYRGPSAASEPETQAIQNYVLAEFPDQRGPNRNDPAPTDASGIWFDIHSYGRLVLWPWGQGPISSNEPAFATFGRKLAFYNGYEPQRATELTVTDGTTLDFGYGELGIASLAYELGNAFFESCSAFENTIVPANLPSLIYAAKSARTPYRTPAGPDILQAQVDLPQPLRGESVSVTALVDDTRYNNSNGTEPTQTVRRAEYFVETPPWSAGAVPLQMVAVDGNFDSAQETVEIAIDTTPLEQGRYTVYLRGRDSLGNSGAVSAIFIDVIDPVGDVDGDGTPNGVDCAPDDGAVWSAPSAPRSLSVAVDGGLAWQAPTMPGGGQPLYDVLRALTASELSTAVCLATVETGTTADDPLEPAPGFVQLYLIRARNECGSGLGTASGSVPRPVPDCP